MLVVPYKPTTGEGGTYKRAANLLEYTKAYLDLHQGRVKMTWQTESGSVAPAGATGRARINQQPVGDWVAFDSSSRCAIDYGALPDGKYLLGIELSFSGTVLEKLVLVAQGDISAVADDDAWVSVNRFQNRYGPYKNKAVRVPYVPYVPKVWPLKARPIQTYTHRPTQAQLWVTTIGSNVAAEVTPSWALSFTGMKVPENLQKYFYSDATKVGQTNPQFEYPQIALIDGPRGVGTIGHAYNGIIRRGRKGYYIGDTNGRVVFRSPDGAVTTLFGIRNRKDVMRRHSGMIDATWMNNLKTGDAAKARELYDSAWEMVGDWSRLSGPKTPLEPWKVGVLMRRPDGTIDKRDGHEGHWCDTLRHRILFWDHWTAHSHANYQKAHFPPANYIPPDAPTGQTILVDFVWTPDGLPRDYCNEPWAFDINVLEGRLYWCNFGNNSIYSCKLDGTDIKPFHIGPQNPTYLALGAANGWRLGRCSASEVLVNRTNYVRDGFISTRGGTASLIKPQGLVFSHDYKFMYVAERYTYVIREINMETGAIRVLFNIPKIDSGSDSASTNDIQLAIDNEGTCGPVDDMWIAMWRNNRRFSKDGVDLGALTTTTGQASLSTGPLNLADHPDYAWGIMEPGDGEWGMIGNAAGFQDITVTLRRPDDPTPNMDMWFAGHWLYMQTLGLDHGPIGRGRLGLKTIDDLGALADAQLLAYWRAASSEPIIDWNLGGAPGRTEHINARNKMVAAGKSVDEVFLYFVRWQTQGVDYSAEQPDALPPATPETDLLVTIEGYAMGMYTLQFEGTAPVNPVAELNDIAGVRVYVDGSAVSAPASPGGVFQVSVQHPGPGPLTVEHSFVDEVGNESARFSQTVVLPDVAAPMAPVEPLDLVSVVWAA